MELSPEGMKRLFTDENFAYRWLEQVRWEGVPTCPRCGSTKAWNSKSQSIRMGTRACKDCGRIYNVLTDTPMMYLQMPLNKWLHGLYIMSQKPSARPAELANKLGIGMTAAYRLHEKLSKVFNKEGEK